MDSLSLVSKEVVTARRAPEPRSKNRVFNHCASCVTIMELMELVENEPTAGPFQCEWQTCEKVSNVESWPYSFHGLGIC